MSTTSLQKPSPSWEAVPVPLLILGTELAPDPRFLLPMLPIKLKQTLQQALSGFAGALSPSPLAQKQIQGIFR